MEVEKEVTKEKINIEEIISLNKNINNHHINIEIKKLKDIINKIYPKYSSYNEKIVINEFQNNIGKNLDNFYNKFINNKFNIYSHNEFYFKEYIKFRKKINFIAKKLYCLNNETKIKIKNNSNKVNISFLINSQFVFKNLINEKNHIYIQKFFKILILFQYYDIISLITFKFIVELYINIFCELILDNSHYLLFINDIIEGFAQFPFRIENNNNETNNNLFIEIINIFQEYFVNDPTMKMKISKSLIWLKLLGNKIISNLDNKEDLNKLYKFLVDIYKYNISVNFLFENIYKYSAVDLNYYLNSINFLSNLFKDEAQAKKNINNFNIKNGFYIPMNNPLILEKINFKENEFSLIFSFRIMNNEKDKEIIIFNLSNNVNGNVILKLIINKDNTLKLIHGNKGWVKNDVNILNNKDYLVCISQSYSSYSSTKLLFFINNINNDKNERNSLANKNVIVNANNIKTKKNALKFNSFEIQSPYPYFSSQMILELGKSNFNGIIGDFIIINKKLNEVEVQNLFNLAGYYSIIAENLYDKYDLVNKFDNYYVENSDNIIFLKNLKFNCIIKILSNKLNNKFVRNKKILKIENIGILKHKNNQKIKVIDLKYSLDFFYNKNGIEFLLFQLHNIANIIDNNLNLFNIYLYHTLKFFYDIMINIDDDNTGKKKNDSFKFNYFILSLMIILFKIKKKENIRVALDDKIYELLLKYIDFYRIHNYYIHRNLIFSILLDDSLFNQKKLLKEGTIFIYLLDIINNNINNDKEIINQDILSKILNLDFILESKEYHHHKLYMKLIMNLLLITNNKILYENIIKYIILTENHIKLYHHLKNLYINFESLKDLLKNNQSFSFFIKKYLQKTNNNFHCKYCFNTIFLVYQIREELLMEGERSKNKIKHNKKKSILNINNKIIDKDFFIRHHISLIKAKFINCFNIHNDIKLKFIKNYRCSFSSGDNNNITKGNAINNNTIIHLESNLLNYKNVEILLSNFDLIINELFSVWNIYLENKNNLSVNNDDNQEKELINNALEIFKFFWEEVISFYRKEKNNLKENINFLYQLLSLNGTETFFRIFFTIDYDSAISILHQIIILSINKIKNPFYYKYIEIDEKIDKNDKINNEKIKNGITEKIIIEINKINSENEVIIQNRKNLLIIVNEIVQSKSELNDDIVDSYIKYINNLSNKKFFYNKILYKVKEEYLNLLQLSLNIFSAISKQNQKYNDLLYNFVIKDVNKSIFFLIDEDIIKGKYSNKIYNNKKEIDISNILYCFYYLIYFIEMKNDIEKSQREDKEKIIVYINMIISCIFYNSKEIFKLVSNKKNYKNVSSKVNKINLDIYNIIFNFYLNSKKFFAFEDLEKYYKEIKLNNLKSKSVIPKESKKNVFVASSSKKNENFDKSYSQNFTVEYHLDNKQKGDVVSYNIIENYIPDNEKINEKNDGNKNMHNSISGFSRKKKELKNCSSSFNKMNEKERIEIKKLGKMKTYEEKGETIGNNEENLKGENKKEDIDNMKTESSEDESSEDESNTIDNKNDKEDFGLETKKIPKITSSHELNRTNSMLVYSTTNSSISKTYSVAEENKNINNISLNINNTPQYSSSKPKKLKEEIKIPIFYYKQLINYNQLYFTKILANPKTNYLWKIFTYSFNDYIFNNKNFIKLSKCFKVFSKKYNVELSSKEESKFHLNYPTKIKNFICNDYYRPFLKPDMKFFNRELSISHNYIPEKIIEKIKKENKLSKIKFIKFFPINEKEKDLMKFYCENVSYKGSIFGKMYILESFFAFVNKSYNNIKKNKEELLFFLFSKEDIMKYKNIKKVIIFYYNEVKEIIIRRFCLKFIGYEIFLKDGRSYLFNFFNKEEANNFSNCIQTYCKNIIIINDPINYFEKKEYKSKFKKGEIDNFQYLLLLNKFSTRTYNNISQYLVFPILFMSLSNNILRDLSKAVCLNKEDPDELIKYKMNYDLMKCHFNNHYSTSAYVIYYLVRLIPYTYLLIDFQSGKFDVAERIFSNYNNYYAALTTSSENREMIPEFFHNYEFCLNLNNNNIGKMQMGNILINNFNSNKYKTSVEFIINHRKYLDDNVNITPWINNIFGCNQINESKDLMNIFPLYSYEQFSDIDEELDKIKETLKNNENYYIEIYNNMKNKLAILDLGITPIQMFKTSHPEQPATNNTSTIDLNSSIKSNSKNLSGFLNSSNSSFTDENNNSQNINDKKSKKKKNKEKKINELFIPIRKIISCQKSQKYRIILNNQTMSLFFIFKQTIIIHNIIRNSKKTITTNEPEIDYPITLQLKNKLLQIDTSRSLFSKNICFELMQGFYCICRNDNKTLKFVNYNQKHTYSYLWICIITAIEPYINSISHTNYLSEYNWKIFFGDEEGTLCILDTSFKYIFKNSEYKMTDIKVTKKIKIHKNYINNLLYNDRLNIVISSSGNGDISINNAYSLETLNFIKIGNCYSIFNIKVSFYDLLYIVCYNSLNKNYYLKCFTLNGIKVTKIKTEKKIINFFINDFVNIFYEDKSYDRCSLYNFKEKKTFDNFKKQNNKSINSSENEIHVKEDHYSDEENEGSEDNDFDDMTTKLVHCNYCNKISRLINIYDNNEMSLEKL